MSPAKQSGRDIEINPLLARLLSHGVDAIAFRGYVGPSKKEGTIRLYPTLGFLNVFIDIGLDDIVETAPAPTTVLPHGGMIVWVKSDAEVVFHGDTVVTVLVRTLRRQRAAIDQTSANAPSSDAAKYVDVVRGRLRMGVPAGTLRDDVCASCRGCASCTSVCQSGVVE
jgi:ferredoxin